MRRTACFFDTETTGLPLFKEPSEHPGQPHIVQLGACLVDLDSREVLSTLDVMIKPDGWLIPDKVDAIHGITTEKAAGFTKFKSANLREAYLHFTGRELQNAHSALADVHGCMAVWFGIQDLQAQLAAA